jgi:hypothetical protein
MKMVSKTLGRGAVDGLGTGQYTDPLFYCNRREKGRA